MYKYIESNQPTYFDVDDTLVMWNVPITDAAIVINGDPVMINQGNVDALLRHAMRGHTIVVWSAGGSDWAKAVVEALGLRHVVDLVIEKPRWYYDDMAAASFMGKPHYEKYEPKGEPNDAA